jgi:2-keto-4-pentenoate hydratase/2-oxohepta-3-ene-1,7-dioic acid hydratase in catechol pathway
MRFATFADATGRERPGVISGDSISPLPPSVESLYAFIGMDQAARQAALKQLGSPQKLAEVRLLAPVRPPKNVFCVGRNYVAHAEEGARARGIELKLPELPTFFTKAPNTIIGPDAEIALEAEVSSQYDWEAELAVVIGKRCKDVREEDALGVVFGYCCLNDVTARDMQRDYGQWFKGKSLDNSCPLGPWIVDTQEITDAQNLEIMLRVNGVEKQHSNTRLMIFNIKRIIHELTKGYTLDPGDVIATGTPEGVGFARTPPEFLKDGDVVEVEIEKIGILRNTVRLLSAVAATR